MIKSDFVVERAKNLVSWNIELTEETGGLVKAKVHVIFSYERANTQMGTKQGAHVRAHALNVMRAMKIVSDFAPVEANKFAGISELIYQMRLVEEQDTFLLNRFFPNHNIKQRQTMKNLCSSVESEKELANSRITALTHSAASARSYQNLPEGESLTASGNAAVGVLSNLEATDARILEDVKLIVRRDYSMSVLTKAATGLLEYQNTAPYAAFERIPARDAAEKKFNKGEGRRVRDALAALKPYGSINVDVDIVDDDNDDELEIAAAASIIPMTGASKISRGAATKAKAKISSIAAYENEKPRELSEKDIVTFIDNLLYYPPVDADYVKGAENNQRTNDINALGFVIAGHLITVFATFDKLEKHFKKENIIDAFIDKILKDWSRVIEKEDKAILKEKIVQAIADWDKKKQEMVSVREQDLPSSSGINLSLMHSPDYKPIEYSSDQPKGLLSDGAISNLNIPLSSGHEDSVGVDSGEEYKISEDDISDVHIQAVGSPSNEQKTTATQNSTSDTIHKNLSQIDDHKKRIAARRKRAEERHKTNTTGVGARVLPSRDGGQKSGHGFTPAAAIMQQRQSKSNIATDSKTDEQASNTSTGEEKKPFRPGGSSGANQPT